MKESTTHTTTGSDNGFDAEEQKDLDNEIIDLKEPFDPKKIDIQVVQTTMDNLIKRMKYDEIDLNADFQRAANLWKTEIKSRLIESLMIRLPIPAFYFDATIDEKWQVVDGLQRLTTIKRFVIDQDFRLKGLEFLKEDFEGKLYKDLDRNFTRRIDEAPVTLYLIKPGTPRNVKYSLFYRINTGGLNLNAQEIRHALSQGINDGRASKFLAEVAETEFFKNFVRASNKRMLDKELILRFVAFKLNDYGDYKEPMIKFLNDVMETLGTLEQEELRRLKTGFKKAAKLSWELFGEDAFRKSFVYEKSPKMINRGLFEVVTVVFSNFGRQEKEKLLKNKMKFVERFKELLKNDKFFNAITSSTATAENVKLRFNEMYELVNEFLVEE